MINECNKPIGMQITMTPVFGSDPPAPPDVCFTCILPDTIIDRFRADPASLPYVVFIAKLQILSSA